MSGLEIQSKLSLSVEDKDKNCYGRLVDLDLLHCPICYEPLSQSIFQCENGHIACSKCCTKMENECPVCDLPIGLIRCRALEKIIKAIIVPCPNAKLGCTESFSDGQELTHRDKECTFSLCSCLEPCCDYIGSYKDIYKHFDDHKGEHGCSYQLSINEFAEIYVDLRKCESFVMMERSDDLCFVAESFTEKVGVYVTMCYIAPSPLTVGEFSSHISAVVGTYSMTFEFPKVKKASVLSFETPKEDFMFIPSYITRGHQFLKLKICFTKLNKE